MDNETKQKKYGKEKEKEKNMLYVNCSWYGFIQFQSIEYLYGRVELRARFRNMF